MRAYLPALPLQKRPRQWRLLDTLAAIAVLRGTICNAMQGKARQDNAMRCDAHHSQNHNVIVQGPKGARASTFGENIEGKFRTATRLAS